MSLIKEQCIVKDLKVLIIAFIFFKTGFLNFPFVGAYLICRINLIPNAGFPSYRNLASLSMLHLFLKSVH